MSTKQEEEEEKGKNRQFIGRKKKQYLETLCCRDYIVVSLYF